MAAGAATLRIRAISLDLDDTLWPVEPAITAAEHALDAWLRREHPAVAAVWPIPAMRALRERIAAERPDLAHDFSAQRRLALAHAFGHCGADGRHVDAAYEVYFAARNRVDCYADALPALTRLSARFPLVSVSNGNADLARIGLDHHFAHSVSARECGVAKPHPAIFREACALLGLRPEHVLHVGDDPQADVAGARSAGLRTAWLNRHARPEPAGLRADVEFRDLGELARWLDAPTAATTT